MKKFFLSAMLVLSTCSAVPVSAQVGVSTLTSLFCDNTKAVEELLTNKYEEKLLFVAPIEGDITFQLWARESGQVRGETWTMLVSYPNGISCAYVASREWTMFLPPNV